MYVQSTGTLSVVCDITEAELQISSDSMEQPHNALQTQRCLRPGQRSSVRLRGCQKSNVTVTS
ncbi:hypothetical protein INR49_000700 [Caranx melampygus]|nr:hypothetical protein INR49_000700 [Caranx melampygus]